MNEIYNSLTLTNSLDIYKTLEYCDYTYVYCILYKKELVGVGLFDKDRLQVQVDNILLSPYSNWYEIIYGLINNINIDYTNICFNFNETILYTRTQNIKDILKYYNFIEIINNL